MKPFIFTVINSLPRGLDKSSYNLQSVVFRPISLIPTVTNKHITHEKWRYAGCMLNISQFYILYTKRNQHPEHEFSVNDL